MNVCTHKHLYLAYVFYKYLVFLLPAGTYLRMNAIISRYLLVL